MPHTPKILAFAGSARKDSFNKKLIKIAVKGAENSNAKVTLIDLGDFPLPLYDADLETAEGLPENAKKIKNLMRQADGFLISAPEYNSSITPLLKNTLDWASRSEAGETPLVCYNGKVSALMSASPGALGGLRGLVTLRSMLGNIGVLVLPDQIAIPKADQAFAEDGSLKDAKQQDSILQLGRKLTELLVKLQK